ncbi:MAG: PAS domain S-box protein [Candidatus Thermoplasmatota archaeon]|nr:PAS domain S-box protein [Candidatus Thermoplasmatota archaeon]
MTKDRIVSGDNLKTGTGSGPAVKMGLYPENDQNYRRLVETLIEGIWAIDAEGRTTFVNPAMARMLGYSVEEMAGRHLFDFMDEEMAPLAREYLGKCMSGIAESHEFDFRRKDGSRLHALIATTPILGKNGEYSGAVAGIQDISISMQTEKALRTSEERLDLAMALNHEGIWDWNLVTNETYFDDRYYTMAGYEPGEFDQDFLAWSERVHPEDLPSALEAIDDYLSGRSSDYDIEFRFRCKDGDWIWIRGRGSFVERDANGKPIRMIGTHTDITSRKRAEDALKRSEEKFRLLADNTLDVIWKMDLDLTFTYVNPASLYLLGHSPEEFIGTNLSDHCDPNEFARMSQIIKKILEKPLDKQSAVFEIVLRHKDGIRVQCEIHGRLILDDEGHPVALQGTTRDITERKAWEREIGDLNSFLLSIRNLNQETVKQDDFNELLKGSCRILTEIRGYIDVSIYYLDKDGRIRPQAHYGEHAHDPWTYDPVTESGAPECVMESLRSKKPVTIETCDERCAECEYCSHDMEHQLILVPMLDRDGNLRGFIHACLDPGRELHKEEISLFEEVAGDLVFAHDKIMADRRLKKSEFDLRDRNQFINTILENLNLGVAVNSMDSGLVEYTNPSFSRIYGWPPEDVKDVDRFFELVYPDPEYRENLKRRVMEDIASGYPDRMRWDNARITTKSGENRIVEARNIPLPEQNLMISTVWDVTERNTARQRLIESERKYRTLIETTSEGYWLVDNDGITIEVNDALLEMIGYEREQVLGKRPTEFMDETNRSIFDTMFSKKTKQHHRTYGLQLQTAKGDNKDTIINATTVFDLTGRAKGTFAMITDISDLKRANEALEREKRKSETLLDLISHDIGNIHQGILSSLELLDAASLPEEVRRRNLLNIKNLANRSVHLVKNVLVLTRLESMDKNLNDIDVIGSIERALDSCRSAFPDRTIHYRTICDRSPLMIKAEPILEEVFFNIFHNGIKVQKERDPRLEAEVIPDPDNFCVRIRISDWGPGIPDESKEKLLYRSRTPCEKVHSGIGLSLVRELVTRYNGRIRILDRVQGDQNSGACFELTFPSP